MACSAVAYLAFLAASTYALGFFADLGTPTSVDGLDTGDPTAAVLRDLLLVLGFCVPHSVMARSSFKRTWTRVVPPEVERSTYVLVASALLAALMGLWQPIGPSLYRVDGLPRVALLALQALGWFLVVWPTFLVDHAQLFGLRTPARSSRAAADVSSVLVERGVYRYVRHPLMTGFLVVFWTSWHMSGGRLLLALALTGYVVVGTALEERDLLTVHGAAYAEYRSRVPAFVPVRRRG